jgi:hypothetical protein
VLIVLFFVLWRWLANRGDQAVFSGPLPRFVTAAIGIAFLGAILDQALLFNRDLAAAVLRYYWFRLSDVMTPLGVTFALIVWQQQASVDRPRAALGMLVGLLAVAVANVLNTVVEHRLDPRPGAVAQAFPAKSLTIAERNRRWQEWQRLSAWVSDHTQPTDLFLTPRNQQTFKWHANRPEVVNGKDIPQDAVGIVAWRRRMDEVFPYTVRWADLLAHRRPRIMELSRKYGFRYIVVDRGVSTRAIDFPRVYPEPDRPSSIYEVYRVPLAN